MPPSLQQLLRSIDVRNVAKDYYKTTRSFQFLLVHLWQDVADVVPWVSVQALLQPLLVEEVADETDAASQYKHSVQGAGLDVSLRLVLREEPAGIYICF